MTFHSSHSRDVDVIGFGCDGHDTLKGGAGKDTLKGGAGADVYQLSKGKDHILDFKPQRGDRIVSKSSFSLQILERSDHLVLLDPTNNIHTTLHNTSLETLLSAQPGLIN